MDFLSALRLLGRRRDGCPNHKCVTCGKDATEFDDDISRQEYRISMMCQECQDEVFGPNWVPAQERQKAE